MFLFFVRFSFNSLVDVRDLLTAPRASNSSSGLALRVVSVVRELVRKELRKCFFVHI